MLFPSEDISGKARPSGLNRPDTEVDGGSEDRYLETAESWYAGRAKTLENPPPENAAADSEPDDNCVAPTEVTKGQPDGKDGTKL